MNVRIVIVEDDPLLAEMLAQSLNELVFSDAEIQIVPTESDFRSHFDQFRAEPPDVVIMDVMLRWANPAPDMPPRPEDVRSGGIFEGGLRCLEMLDKEVETKSIPVIIHTLLNRDEVQGRFHEGALPKQALYLSKKGDLSDLVHSVLVALGKSARRPSQWKEAIWQSIEAKPGGFGFSIDLKRIFSRRSKKGGS